MKKIEISFLIGICLSGSMGKAQVGIGTDTPKARLHVADSSVVFTAVGRVPLSPGNPPVSGGGRRLMWYPDKAAFRVGYVSDNAWDKNNIGAFSFASGAGTIAKGTASTATGLNTRAEGASSFAAGENAVASGDKSFAFGQEATASGLGAIAMGRRAKAEDEAAVALGAFAWASGRNSVAIVYSPQASPYSVAIGFDNKASGSYGAVALGYETEAEGDFSFTAGHSTRAKGKNSTAMGARTIAPGGYEFAIGAYNTDYQVSNANTPMGVGPTDRVFVIGNGYYAPGADPEVRRDAFTVLWSGNVGIGYGVGSSAINTYKFSVNGTAAKPGGGAWMATSDIRAKKNIIPYQKGLREILQIEPVRFQYNRLSGHGDTTAYYVGVIAQEIENVLPSTVSVAADDSLIAGKQVFDSSELLYTLINAVKELSAANQVLQSRVSELVSWKEDISARLEQMEGCQPVRLSASPKP